MADVALAHAGEARSALRAIVSDPGHGPGALADIVVMSGLLKDLLPGAPRETGVLLAAVSAGVPVKLRDHAASGMDAGTAIHLAASSLASLTAFAPDVCTWAAAEFAAALGIVAEGEEPVTIVLPPDAKVAVPVLPDDSPVRAASREVSGPHDERIRHHERVVASRERVFGADHPDTLAARDDLAYWYERARRLDEAIGLREQNLADRERLLGSAHPDTIGSRNGLAEAWVCAQRFGDAACLLEQSVADCDRVLGPDHPLTWESRSRLADVYQYAGWLDDAIPLLERKLRRFERLGTMLDPNVMSQRWEIALAYRSAGRLADAISLLEALVDDYGRAGRNDRNAPLASESLGLAYRSAGRLAEAIALLERAAAECERLGRDYPYVNTWHVRHELALAYRSAGRLDEAIAALRRNLDNAEQEFGPDAARTLETRDELERTLGECRQRQDLP